MEIHWLLWFGRGIIALVTEPITTVEISINKPRGRKNKLKKNLQQKSKGSKTHNETEGCWTDSSNETKESHTEIKPKRQETDCLF